MKARFDMPLDEGEYAYIRTPAGVILIQIVKGKTIVEMVDGKTHRS